MTWNTLGEVKIRSREGNVELFTLQSDGNFYRIRNEFGNISFEFDVSSGYELAEILEMNIIADINREANNFMNAEDAFFVNQEIDGLADDVMNEIVSGDNDSVQLDLFDNRQSATR